MLKPVSHFAPIMLSPGITGAHFSVIFANKYINLQHHFIYLHHIITQHHISHQSLFPVINQYHISHLSLHHQKSQIITFFTIFILSPNVTFILCLFFLS